MAEEYAHFFEVDLELFAGPIDLLLHLVKQNELPIEKLSLAQVASQYFSCLERMRYFDLEIAGEYLVIAATLVSIKSSILLNEPVQLVVDDEGNLVNPHDELLQKLREAAVYRVGAGLLGDRKLLGVDVFESAPSLDQIGGVPVKYRDHDAMLLGEAFRKLLQKAPAGLPFSIVVEHVSVVERMMTILDLLKAEPGGVDFVKLIPDLTSRMSIIGSFVALLELCKRNVIQVRQDKTFENISVALTSEEFDPQKYYSSEQMTSEFDEVEAPAEASVNA